METMDIAGAAGTLTECVRAAEAKPISRQADVSESVLTWTHNSRQQKPIEKD